MNAAIVMTTKNNNNEKQIESEHIQKISIEFKRKDLQITLK